MADEKERVFTPHSVALRLPSQYTHTQIEHLAGYVALLEAAYNERSIEVTRTAAGVRVSFTVAGASELSQKILAEGSAH